MKVLLEWNILGDFVGFVDNGQGSEDVGQVMRWWCEDILHQLFSVGLCVKVCVEGCC